MKAIVTIPPYAPYLKRIVQHPLVEGLRLNTVMPVNESLDELLSRLKEIAGDKQVWIDLKCRQLRVSRGVFYNSPKEPVVLQIDGQTVVLDPSNPKTYGQLRTPPWVMLEIDHEIELDTTKPVKCYFNDGYDSAHIARVEGNKLIMLDGPKKVIGGGESINVIHPSLKIKGYLTGLDVEYIEAGKRVGIDTLMLSYVEGKKDVEDVLAVNQNAQIVAKIESQKGLEFVVGDYSELSGVRLMAARGDLYVEVGRPHKILRATRKIVEANPAAIAASRLLPSLGHGYTPSCQDISDVGFLMEIGFSHFMIGDDICFNEDSLFSALNLMQAIGEDYTPRKQKHDGGALT